MKTLIVDDDLASRKLMQLMLSRYGECDLAVNGKEALERFVLAAREGKRYDLICLDIMMPEIDGRIVLRKIRELEQEKGIIGREAVKIIMTTALSNSRNILEAFNAQCEAYLVKPVGKKELLRHLEALGLLNDSAP